LAPDAALAELRTIADGLDAEVDAVAKPILAIDDVVKDLKNFARTFRVKPSQVKALAKASLSGRAVDVPAGMQPEVAEELRAMVVKVKAADDALGATPDRAADLLAKIATRHARVQTLARAAATPARATLADPHTTDSDRSAAAAKVSEVEDLQADARRKLDVLRGKVRDLSAQVMAAIAKLGDATQ
jgi:hypothetical protein